MILGLLTMGLAGVIMIIGLISVVFALIAQKGLKRPFIMIGISFVVGIIGLVVMIT